MFRNGMSYMQASNNANHVARNAYSKAINNGATKEMAQHEAFITYEKEMNWYERKDS